MMSFGMFGGMFIFWVVLIALAVLLVRSFFPSNQVDNYHTSKSQPSARQILEERYARGEINQEQFLQMQKDLQSQS